VAALGATAKRRIHPRAATQHGRDTTNDSKDIPLHKSTVKDKFLV
jgi:hypothetical protein